MSVAKCQKEFTHREYLSWMIYYREKWGDLSLTDYYLMRVAQRCHQAIAKNPNKVGLEDQKIEFKTDNKPKPKQSLESADAISKARWGARLSQSGAEYKIRKS